MFCVVIELFLDDVEVWFWGVVEVVESLVDDGLLWCWNGRYFLVFGVKLYVVVDVWGVIGG